MKITRANGKYFEILRNRIETYSDDGNFDVVVEVLKFFDKRNHFFPFSSIKIENGHIQSYGEWDGFTYNSPKMKLRVFKKLFGKDIHE